MRLIDPADGKGFYDPLMHPLALECFFPVKRTFMLVDHDPVLVESIVAIPIEFLRKQSFPRAKGIG